MTDLEARAVSIDATPEDADALRRERTRQHYVLAAVLFIGGGIGAIPPDMLHVPRHPVTIYLLPLLAVVSGALTLALAGRLPRRYLHAIAVVAALEVALTTVLAAQIFAIYFTFIAIFAAYVFRSRGAIAAHVCFVAVLSFATLVLSVDPAREGLIQALVLAPTLVLAGGAVAYLRERLAESEERYRRLSERDPLTGVGNYRMLTLRVPGELRHHGRHERPLALLVFDLDDFKRINDSYGHQRGDAVLQQVAATLLAGVRDHDVVVRQGGDEFAVVAPETAPDAAAELAERLRAAIGAIRPDGAPLGASVGSAAFPGDSSTLEGLLAAADARLREQKVDRTNQPRRGDAKSEPEAPEPEPEAGSGNEHLAGCERGDLV